MSMHRSRHWLVAAMIAVVASGGFVAPHTTRGDARPEKRQDGGRERDEVDRAVEQAVAYLLKNQRDDGAITDKDQRENRAVMTSLSLLAMAAVGHQPSDKTDEGKAMRRALVFVLDQKWSDRNGYYGGPDGSRMYGHGITTLMLSEMLGMGVDDEMDQLIRRRLEKAIDLILAAQRYKRKQSKYKGGWRYQPDARDADLSLTVWQLMALRSAKNAGLDVPKDAIDDAVDYLKRSYHSRRDSKGNPTNLRSGFTYQPDSRDVRFTSTSMGLLAMQVCGEYDAPEVTGAANWLQDRNVKTSERFFLYGLYYYSQGMYQYAERLKRNGKIEEGQRWARTANEKVKDLLLRKQRRDGAWRSDDNSERSAGYVYCTSMAVLSLSVKYHYLPIYQG